MGHLEAGILNATERPVAVKDGEQHELRLVHQSRIEIPDWLHEVPARQVADVMPITPALRAAFASFSTSASLKAVVEILEVRLEHRVGVKGWDREDLVMAVAWVIEAKSKPVASFLDEAVRTRVDAILATQPASNGNVLGHVFENLRRMLDTPLLSAMSQWKMRPQAVSRHVGAVVTLLERLAGGRSVSVLDEIALFFEGMSERDRTFVIRYLGLDGKPDVTLESLGEQAGITRERVRQIVQRFINRNSPLRPPMPVCEATVDVLTKTKGPITLDRWREELPDLLRPDSPSVLSSLRTLERWGWLGENTWLRAGGLMLVIPGPGREDIGREFLRRVTPAIRNAMALGAASVGHLSLAMHQERTAVESLLRSSGRWDRVDADWFILKDSAGYLIPRIATKMLGVLGPLTLDQLRGGLRRYRESRSRQRINVPPRVILGRVLRAAGMNVSESNEIVTLADKTPMIRLNGGEAALMHAFDNGNVLTLHEVIIAIKEQGLSEALGQYLLSSCPLIARLTYGLYSLRGRAVSHMDIESAANRLAEQSAPSLIDQRFEIDGSILVRYRFPTHRDLVTFYIRGGMIPEGVWTLVEGQRRAPILVRASYVTGLQQLGRRMKRAGFAEIEVRFDVGRGEVRVAGSK